MSRRGLPTARPVTPPESAHAMRASAFSVLLLILLLADAAAAIDVFVRSPRAGKAVFGTVTVELEVLAPTPVAWVEVRVDGELAARLEGPPWRLEVDVGEENRPHLFEIVAEDAAGERAVRRLETPALATDEQLDVDLQQLYVTVTRDERRILDLGREAFEILDQGVAQGIVTFERGDVPFTAVLLIDTSSSMQGEQLRTALAGARAFVRDMRPLDEARVVLFSDRTLAMTPFTGDPEAIAPTMTRARATGGTAIHDHLYLALKTLEARQGRRVVILLSDGEDIDSALAMDDVAWKTGRSQALIYWLRTGGAPRRFSTAWRDAETQRRELVALERTVHASGGRIRAVTHIDDVPRAFGEILAELREQYVFGYYPSDDRDDGAWHEVRVRVRVPGARVRARGGYHDDPIE